MKYTLCITQQCNLRCKYCYVDKASARMPLDTAEKAIDFIYERTPADDDIDIGFFGGEPLLEFELIEAITDKIERHPEHDPERVELTLVSNGTIFNPRIADFIIDHDVGFGISCDGPPEVHDLYRVYKNGKGSGRLVERNIKRALERFPNLMVNAVYRPQTLHHLPEVVRYFAALGVRHIYLNADFSAEWSPDDAALLPGIFAEIAEIYVASYLAEKPLYISVLDSKITVILRGGFRPTERCSMGRGELAFTANGNIFPCERLIGSGDDNEHCIGNLDTGIEPGRMACRTAPLINAACLTCGLRDYCANSCGCSNFFASGYYNRVGAFQCALERATVQTACGVIEAVESHLGPVFSDHLAGEPAANTVAAHCRA